MMMADIGSISLVLIFLISITSLTLYLVPIRLGYIFLSHRSINLIIFTLASFSQLALIYSFIISDFSVANVYNNSHQLKPLIYKISGSWGNHEGSMILLILVLSSYSLAFNLFSSAERKIKDTTSVIQIVIIGLFAAFTFFTSNPFERIYPAPLSGLELNPILQDIGLAFHPPMLYAGYIGFSLIFSFSISCLLHQSVDKRFAKLIKGWLFLCYGFLTLGIALGSWWAYRELGWGGFWFWDPVENVSLMPWIAATAMIHANSVLENSSRLKIWSVFLGILTFTLCLVGLFLVRSGVLTSVHSFAIDAQRGFFVILLISLISGFGFFVLALKANKIKASKPQIKIWSRAGAIIFNNYFLLISLLIILLGTVYPIVLQSFFGQFISIGASYYNSVFAVLLVPFLALLILVYKMKKENKFGSLDVSRKDVVALLFLVALFILVISVYKVQALTPLVILLSLFGIYSIISTKQPFSTSQLPMHMAHLGFLSVVLGAVISIAFGEVKEINLKERESFKISSYEIVFDKISYGAGKNFIAREAEFLVKKDQKKIGILKPQLRYYPVSDITTNEASIRNRWFSDLYVVIGNKDELDNYAIRAYYRPFIYLIWIGALMIVIAAALKVVRSSRL